MSGLNQFAVQFVVSGDAFFVDGAGLILLGRVTSWRFAQRHKARWLRLVTVLGVILLVLSVTPLPLWLYGLCVALPLLSLNLPWRVVIRSVSEGECSADPLNPSLVEYSPSLTLRVTRMMWRAQPLVELCLLTAVVFELRERHQLYARSLATIPTEVHVIGDSLTAGIANEQDSLWPNLVSREWHVPVHNHAHPGADTKTAMRQAEAIRCDDCLMLIEIGGNDLLSGRDSQQIAADFEGLVAKLQSGRRSLILFELPVPPISGAYEWTRLQRRLAHQYGVRLIPRRDFAQVLLSSGTTTDGLLGFPAFGGRWVRSETDRVT